LCDGKRRGVGDRVRGDFCGGGGCCKGSGRERPPSAGDVGHHVQSRLSKENSWDQKTRRGYVGGKRRISLLHRCDLLFVSWEVTEKICKNYSTCRGSIGGQGPTGRGRGSKELGGKLNFHAAGNCEVEKNTKGSNVALTRIEGP